MRNLSITTLLILAAGAVGFVMGERKGRIDGHEEFIEMLVPSQSRNGTEAADVIEVKTTVRKSSEFNNEATLLGLTMRTSSGKAAIYRGGPLFLEVRPVENRDKTITIAASWSENANAANPETIAIPPVTIVDGDSVIQQVGALRFSFAAHVRPKQLVDGLK